MADFKPSTWAQPVQDIVKEYETHDAAESAIEAPPDKPEAISKSMIRRGVLDPNTGAYGGNSKQKHILSFTPTRTFMSNYERTFGHA